MLGLLLRLTAARQLLAGDPLVATPPPTTDAATGEAAASWAARTVSPAGTGIRSGLSAGTVTVTDWGSGPESVKSTAVTSTATGPGLATTIEHFKDRVS